MMKLLVLLFMFKFYLYFFLFSYFFLNMHLSPIAPLFLWDLATHSAFLFPLLPAFQNQSFSFFYNNAFFFRIRIWFLLLELDQSIPFCSNLIFWHAFTLSIKGCFISCSREFLQMVLSLQLGIRRKENLLGGRVSIFKSCR